MKSLLVLLFSCKHLSGRVTGRTDVELYSWQPRWLTGKKIGRWARRVPPLEMDKTRDMNARLSAPCVTESQKYRLGHVLFYNLNSDFAKCTFTCGVSAVCREEFCISPQLLLEIKVTQTLVFLARMRTREAPALISHDLIHDLPTLISARAIGSVR